MDYRNLGRTGLKVSPLCFGTMNFAYRTPEDEAAKMLDLFIEQGFNFVDTADWYGQPLNDGHGQGETEKMLGKLLKGKRDKVILATKFYMPTDFEDPNARGGSRYHILNAVEASLRRLDTDYIDLYQMHRPDENTPIDETLRALDDLVRSGKVRYIGTSEYASWQLTEALWQSDKLNLHRFISEQPKYNLLMRGIEEEIVPLAQKYGIGILPYSPLAGGVLTGKYREDATAPEGSRMTDKAWGAWTKSFVVSETDKVLDVLAEMSEKKDCTFSQLALAWVIDQPGITSAIIGPRTLAQIEDNLGALDVHLSEADLKQLDEAVLPTT